MERPSLSGLMRQRMAALVWTAALMTLVGCAGAQVARPAPVTVSQVIDMSQKKVPPPDIIQKMADSGTVYRLSAAQLADLRNQGVSDAVIDYMQQTYLEAVRREQARQDWRYWSVGPGGYWYGGRPYGWW